MTTPRATLYALIIAGSLALGATSSFAVMTFVTGAEWDKASQDFKNGYASGALDMLRALEDAKVMTGTFARQAHAVVQCSDKNSAAEIGAMYDDYMKREPERSKRNTASAIYNAIRLKCQIK